MKLTIHAGLFVMGTIEVDTVTGKWSLLTKPLINADQSLTAAIGPIDPQDGLRAGTVALAVLNHEVSQWILKQSGIDARVVEPEPEPIQLTDILGNKGKASA